MGFLSSIKQSVRIARRKDFTPNPQAPPISEEQRKALAVGLINSEQITAFTNSLATGVPKSRIKEGLADAWDVEDRAGAVTCLEWLRDEGHRAYYQEIAPRLGMDPDARNEQLEAIFGDDAETAIGFADNLSECIAGRGGDDIIPFDVENMEKGILAWDTGRMTVVARMAYDIGYLDEGTAWSYISAAYEMTLKEYGSWKEVAAGYLIGRGMWGGDETILNGLYVIAENAFENDNSPWKQLQFP